VTYSYSSTRAPCHAVIRAIDARRLPARLLLLLLLTWCDMLCVSCQYRRDKWR